MKRIITEKRQKMEFNNLEQMARGRLDNSFEDPPQHDEFESLNRRRNSIEQDERDPFSNRGFQGEEDMKMNQIFSDRDIPMSGHQQSRQYDEFDSHANMDCFLKGTEYDIFGQVDRQH